MKAAERRARALELRKGGRTYESIGRTLGVSKQCAHTLVMSALEQLRTVTMEDAARIRELELERLNSLVEALWAKRGDPRTADTLLRIGERRARLLGLDAPTRLEVDDTGGLTDDERAARLETILEAARARRVAQEAVGAPR